MVSFSVQCNNKATTVRIGKHQVHFSYETPIGYDGPLGDCRVENTYSRTTGKHFNAMGIKEYPIVSKEELRNRLDKIAA